MMWSEEDFRKVYAVAESLELTEFVFHGYCYVMDGGSRSYREDGWDCGLLSTSCRKATEEEIVFWDKLMMVSGVK